MQDLWEGWPTGDIPEGDPVCTVTVHRGGVLPTAPAGAAPVGYGSLRGWANDDQLVLAGKEGGLIVDYRHATAVLNLPKVDWDPAFARDTLWRLITLELARTRRRYFLHGAAWIGPLGADVVCAEGGTGKSTLAAAVLQAGQPVITDDGALLVPGQPQRVTALPTAWRLSGPAAHWCGLPDHEAKRRFWPPVAQRVQEAACGRLFFAERAARTALVPLPPAEALPRLIRQNPLLMTSKRIAPAHLDALKELAETVPAARLLLGPEILRDPRNVLNLLAM